MVLPDTCPERLEDLLKLEQRLEREWWWINGALHAVAQLQSDGPQGLRELRTQARTIDRMRIALSVRLAELTRPDPATPAHASRQPL